LSDSEIELINRARQGDQTAYEMLVRAHQEAVFRLAYLLLGDRGEADDVAQDTFIRAFKSLQRFDSTRPLRPWLMRITTNLAYNRRRAIKRYFSALTRMVKIDPDLVAAKEDHHDFEAQALWQAVRQLDRTDQEVIYLRYFMEQSEAETAETLGVAQGTVKSRLHRALGRLRAVMGKDMEGFTR
jgi:RNA polymerase sigma-70 factor (ECF subfamily)